MKNAKFLAAIGALQPFIWFLVYSLFLPWAKKNNSTDFLLGGCVFSALLFCMILIIPVVEKWERNEKK